MENKNRGNNTSNGFWLGLILGVLLTLLFTTKKGRQVLNVLLDKGMQKISDLEDSIKESKYMDDDVDEDGDYIKREPLQEVRYIAEEKPAPSHSAEASRDKNSVEDKKSAASEVAEEDDADEDEQVVHKTVEKHPASNGHAANGHAANGSSSALASAKRFFKKAPKKS